MASPQPHAKSIMETQYLEALQHFDNNDKKKAGEVARYNLTDPNLSRYYRMKNLILVAHASVDDWYEQARCIRKADKLWHITSDLTKEDETEALHVLNELRGTLDVLHQQSKETAPKTVDNKLLEDDCDDDDARSDISETDVYGDDEAAVRAAEQEVFGDDSNIIAMYERAAAAGRQARALRERNENALGLETPPTSEP